MRGHALRAASGNASLPPAELHAASIDAENTGYTGADLVPIFGGPHGTLTNPEGVGIGVGTIAGIYTLSGSPNYLLVVLTGTTVSEVVATISYYTSLAIDLANPTIRYITLPVTAISVAENDGYIILSGWSRVSSLVAENDYLVYFE